MELNALCYEAKGMFEEAFRWYLKRYLIDGSTTEVMALKDAYAASGIRGYYRKRLDLEAAKGPPDAYRMAAFYSRLDERERAFEWLQKAVEERSNNLIYLKVSPAFDNVRSDPRFTELIKRVGLSP